MSEGDERTEEIRRRMDTLRVSLRHDVRDVVSAARDMADWKTYVRRYPWACVGAAAAIGYFIVPTRPRIVEPTDKQILKLAKQDRIHFNTDTKSPKNQTLLATALTFAANAALRAGIAYAGQQLGKVMQPDVDDAPGASATGYRTKGGASV